MSEDLVYLAYKFEGDRKLTLKLEGFGFEHDRIDDLDTNAEFVAIRDRFQALAVETLENE